MKHSLKIKIPRVQPTKITKKKMRIYKTTLIYTLQLSLHGSAQHFFQNLLVQQLTPCVISSTDFYSLPFCLLNL